MKNLKDLYEFYQFIKSIDAECPSDENYAKQMSFSQESNINIFEIGKAYHIETISKYYYGVVKNIQEGFVILENASWIAHTGRYSEAMQKSNAYTNSSAEIEVIGDICIINISHITFAKQKELITLSTK